MYVCIFLAKEYVVWVKLIFVFSFFKIFLLAPMKDLEQKSWCDGKLEN